MNKFLKIKLHIRQKVVVFVMVLLTVLLFSLLVIGISVNIVKKKTMQNTMDKMKSNTTIITDMIVKEGILNGNVSSESVEKLKVFASTMNGRVMVVDTSYKIVLDTYNVKKGEYIIDKDVHRVMTNQMSQKLSSEKQYVEYILPVNDSQGRRKGIVIISATDKSSQEIATYLKKQLRFVFFIILTLSICAAIFIAVLSTKDMKKLRKAINKMKDKELEKVDVSKTFYETKQLTEDFNEAIGKAQILEKSRQEFVSNVSHELKTPITSMKVLSESLIQMDEVPEETYREFMNDIVEEIDRESQIITDLLTLVKSDQGTDSLKFENTDINDLMEVILKRLKPLAEKRNIEIVFESYRDVSADIDKVKFTLAISNLIENGIKYNVDGGKIRVSLNSDYKNCVIKVADTGVGIPDDCVDRIFERFYRVDKARSRDTGGTGLGLAITKNIISMHNGTINVYSEPGKGTTFTVKIPLNAVEGV